MPRDRIVKVSLERILDDPNIIVLKVKKQNPFSEKKKKRIYKLFRSVPDFIYYINYYQVEEIIYNGESVKIKEGQKIVVRSANFQKDFNRHKKYHLENIRKSIYVYEYATEVDISAVDRIIVFVTYNKEKRMFEYNVRDAYDSIDKKEKILHLLENKFCLKPQKIH